MTCQSEKCENEAVVTVFWPGQETRKCLDCAQKAKKLASFMGFPLSMRPISAAELLAADKPE